jgi:hypothetical protein
MEDVGKKCRFNKELAGGGDTENQQPTIKGPALQPQSPGVNEIDRRDLIALSEQNFVSGKRPSFDNPFVET